MQHRKLSSYLVLRDTDAYKLTERAKNYVSRGYELVGGIQVDPGYYPNKVSYYQCLALYEEEEDAGA